jgi:hypothetical protein
VFAEADIPKASGVVWTVGHAGPAVVADTDTFGFLYTRSMQNLFKKVEVRDMKTSAIFDTINNYGLLKTLELADQSPEFYDEESGRDTAHMMGASVHRFTPEPAVFTAAVGSSPTMSKIVPYFDPALTPTSNVLWLSSPVVFPEVKKLLNQIVGKYRFMIPVGSNFLNGAKEFIIPTYNPITIELEPETYAAAFTDVLNVAAGGWPAIKSTNCKGYVVKNMRIMLHAYKLTDITASEHLRVFNSVGWDRNFSQVHHIHTSLAENTTRLTHAINDKVHCLESVAIVIRRNSDTGEISNASSFEFGTGSSTAQTAADYGGVNQFNLRYLAESFPMKPLKMGPGRFGEVKAVSAMIFPGGDDLQKMSYEGLTPEHKWLNNSQTSFFLGAQLCTNPYALKTGIDLTAGPLTIELEFGSIHPALEFDIFYTCAAEMKLSASGVYINI